MKIRWWPDCAWLVSAVAFTRFIFRSHYLYDIDSVNFALALDRFDPSIHQPHPPGYFLYICLGRLANAIFQDANASFVAISIAASAAAVVVVYALADEWFGRKAALFAGLIFLFSPLCWFHGTVALTYIVEAFFSALVGYLCWHIYLGNSGWLLPASAALGLAAGFRPSSLLLLGPVWLLSLSKVRAKQAASACAMLVATVLAWLIPMLRESGGPSAYFESLLALWRIVPSKQTVFNSPIAMSLARFCVVLGISVLCTGAAAIVIFKPAGSRRPLHGQIKKFTWFWITPGLLFFTLIFLKSVNSGYLLVLLPPVFAWLGLWASEWHSTAKLSAPWKVGAIAVCAVVNIAIFLYAPLYCSYREVRRFEKELSEIAAALPLVAAPDETLIVGFDSHFLGYRHAAYYLPRYLTVQYPEVRLQPGLRVFAVEHRGTSLLSSIPSQRFSRFVFFPLPSGDEYRAYLISVRARFQPGALRTAVIGGHEFVTGSVADLPAIFPNLAPVYTGFHPGSEAVYSR